MEKSSSLLKILNNIVPLNDFLYILQLEEYKSLRYLKQLKKFFFRRNLQQRYILKNTKHIKILRLLTSLSITVQIALITNIAVSLDSLLLLLLIPIVLILTPFQILAINLLLSPWILLVTKRNLKAASNKVQQLANNLRVIAITGSFGKTTTKNFINELIKYNYKVQMVPGNINTAIGIANWINKNLKDDTEILLTEMGAYTQNEIKESCQIAPPDIAVITALGDQHLERFGSFENLVRAKNEIFDYAKSDAQKIIPQKYFKFLSPTENDIKQVDLIKKLTYNDTKIKTNLLNKSSVDNLKIALKVAELLNIPENFVKDTCIKLESPRTRKKIAVIHGFETIDDSYNISFKTAINSINEAVELAQRKNKDLLLITAGIPELGVLSKKKNTEYGKYISQRVKNLILLESDYAPYILNGINRSEVIKPKIYTADRMTSAWKVIKENYDPNQKIVLMQPELTDLSY